jgi:hypothetical protein
LTTDLLSPAGCRTTATDQVHILSSTRIVPPATETITTLLPNGLDLPHLNGSSKDPFGETSPLSTGKENVVNVNSEMQNDRRQSWKELGHGRFMKLCDNITTSVKNVDEKLDKNLEYSSCGSLITGSRVFSLQNSSQNGQRKRLMKREGYLFWISDVAKVEILENGRNKGPCRAMLVWILRK